MIRCQEGHFYDPGKHQACPWCGVAVGVPGPSVDVERTRPLRPAETGDQAGGPAGATRALHRDPSGVSPVVGWLVCVEGPDRGRDYRLHSEKNFIGREPGMDICIAGDDSISRQRHAAIVYEPKKKTFWLQPGDAAGLVYLNEELVNTPVQMFEDDTVALGKTKLVLVPFTSAKCQW